MVAPASYGWNHALIEKVPHAGTVDVPAPDINDNVDQDSAELAVDGDLIPDDRFEITFDIAGKKVTVTNLTTRDWEEQSNVYVSAQRTGLGGGDFAALDSQVQDHEARIAALEAAGAPAGARRR